MNICRYDRQNKVIEKNSSSSAPDYVHLYGFYAQKVQNYVENSTSEGDVYVQISSPLRKIQIKLRTNFRPFT